MTLPVLFPQSQVEGLITKALATIHNQSTARAYKRHLLGFIGRFPMDRDGVSSWVQDRLDANCMPPTVNQGLAAIKLLAREAHIRGVIDIATYAGVTAVSGIKQRGARLGKWLTLEQGAQLMSGASPRDRALIAVMMGCGLRRSEVANLYWFQYQIVDDRPVWADIRGKHCRLRTVPIPQWVEKELLAYGMAGPDHNRKVFNITADGIYYVLKECADRAQLDVSPHDLRRTLARWLYESDADMIQIQHTLGHSSVETTTRYINASTELRKGKAAVDLVEFKP